MYSKLLGLTWVFMSPAVWPRNLFWINSQASISTNKVFTRLITLSERVQLDGPRRGYVQVGQLLEFGQLSACGKKESQWRCWVPPALRKCEASFMRHRRHTAMRQRCRRVRTWLPIRLSPRSPQRSPLPCKTESGDLFIQGPPAAPNDMATVVVLVVSKGGNPAAGPNRKKHWTDWFGRHLPASRLRPVV